MTQPNIGQSEANSLALLSKVGLLVCVVLCVCSGCTSTTQTRQDKSTVPKQTPTSTKAAGASSQPALAQVAPKVAATPASTVLKVSLNIKLQHRTTVRTKTSSFMTYTRGRKKVIEVKNGEAWLSLTINTTPPNKLIAEGALKLGDQLQPIRVPLTTLTQGTPWRHRVKGKLKRASALITMNAEVLDPTKTKPDTGRSVQIKFTKVPLSRMFKKLAEFAGYQLILKPGVPIQKNVTVVHKAASKDKLILGICKQQGLACQIIGKVLQVATKTNP